MVVRDSMDDVRRYVIQIRVTRAEYEHICEAAHAAGLSISAWLRQLAAQGQTHEE